MSSPNHYDIAIIGSGCVGAAIAQRLARYELSIALIDREYDVAMGTSKANSGIIHQGYFTYQDSLKRKLSLRANELIDEILPTIDVEMDRIGAFFCALNEEEVEIIKREYENCKKIGVNVEFLNNYEEFEKLEPNINPMVKAVIHFPDAGVISPWELTIGLAEHAVLNGVSLRLGFEVAFIERIDRLFSIHSMEGKIIKSKYVINAAGVFSDRIAQMIGDGSFDITPRRGQYIMFDKHSLALNKILFPCPSGGSKGIVVSPTIHGNFFVGPNAEYVFEKNAINTSTQGLNEILQGGKKIVKDLPLLKHITNFAGLRASTENHDFIITESSISGFFHAAGIDSPGLTASLAIGEYMEKILQNHTSLSFREKKKYIPQRKAPLRLEKLSEIELAKKIQENSQWSNMICRCEHVTEAEIVEACHAPIPATDVDMIKRRLRPGSGRCQGGFCLPKVMKIISREREIVMEKITKRGRNSQIVFRRSKKLCSEIFKEEFV